nr:hypothetical protein BaRGS_013523 [Batillaria attramentaria]
MIYYDYTNARLAVFINVTQSNMDMKRMMILQLTDSSGMRMQYTLDIVNRGCQKMTLSEAMTKACVPDYAGEPMFFTYGAGPETLQAKGWDFKVMETEDDLEAMVAVTEDLCIPIAEDMVGTLTSKDNGFLGNLLKVISK